MVPRIKITTANAALLAVFCLGKIASHSISLADNVEIAALPDSVILAKEILDRTLSEKHQNEESSNKQAKEEQESSSKASDNSDDKNLSYDGSELIDWINSNGGYIHPSVRIGLDPTGQYRGVFVKDDGDAIKDDEIYARIPWDLIIKPKNYSRSRYWNCEAIRELLRQLVLGDQSKHAPYVNYLLNQPKGRMPNEWTSAGKDILREITGKADLNSELDPLPPLYFEDHGFEEMWLGECKGDDTPLDRHAFFQFTSRDEDTLMVPFFDMHNHSNDPKKLNTITSKPKLEGKPFLMRATRDIEPGEQILITYTRCNRCWFDESYKNCETYSHYSTSDVLSIFGFVEDFPQTWVFPFVENDEQVDEMAFCLERKDSGGLAVSFGDNYDSYPVGGEDMEWLEQHLMRLNELGTGLEKDAARKESMPGYEWDMAMTYHKSLVTALSAIIVAAHNEFFAGETMENQTTDEEDVEDDSEDDSDDNEDDIGSEEL